MRPSRRVDALGRRSPNFSGGRPNDHAAAVAAREALRGCPENARALALLADLERRRNGTNLDEFSQRYLAADPTGDVIAVLAPWRNDADFVFLQGKSLSISDFDFAANASRDTGALSGKRIATASLAASQIAAPDLWDNLVRDLSGDEMPGAEGFSEADPGGRTRPR